MIRTQIQLTQAQAKALKKLAAQRGLSVAELIRQAVDHFLQQTESSTNDKKQKWERAMSVVGAFCSDVPDLSINHDEYFAQAIEDYPRRIGNVDQDVDQDKIAEPMVAQ